MTKGANPTRPSAARRRAKYRPLGQSPIATDTTRRPGLSAIERARVTGTPFMVLELRVTTRSGPERKIRSFKPRALFEITSDAR